LIVNLWKVNNYQSCYLLLYSKSFSSWGIKLYKFISSH